MTKHKPAKPQADDPRNIKPRQSVAPTDAPTAAPADQQAAAPSATEESASQLRAELEAARDRELRCRAELDNYRKRAARELDDRLRHANLPLLQDLLPVIDNVERAIEAAEKNADADALLEGFNMVRQQLEDVLKRHHCRRIEALGAPFDPNVHHAVMQQPSDEHPDNTVMMVTQNGYQLHDRVVRPSQVIVSKAE